MSFEILEKQIRSLPENAQKEVEHYVGYLVSIYNSNSDAISVEQRIDKFFKKNPNAFGEFKQTSDVGIKSIQELTKNDVW
ncbi:hypothetical protein [Treponema pectinovorum]|uniref:hypothetical protein n=1 Tax=Treponema pectinovorum TaxID=164 RepID=UPI0011C8D1FE|nr:hypothetical protein [Treponema pectinovorum]